MTGGMKIAKVLYLKGFLAIDGRDGGIFDENYFFSEKTKTILPLRTTFQKGAYLLSESSQPGNN